MGEFPQQKELRNFIIHPWSFLIASINARGRPVETQIRNIRLHSRRKSKNMPRTQLHKFLRLPGEILLTWNQREVSRTHGEVGHSAILYIQRIRYKIPTLHLKICRRMPLDIQKAKIHRWMLNKNNEQIKYWQLIHQRNGQLIFEQLRLVRIHKRIRSLPIIRSRSTSFP